jgi:1,4-alpha-glucan branching enzyme
MGWMHDTLDYFSTDPIYRKYHHERLTFSLWYAFSENFLLSLSHDEVVYGKGSLIRKMPGDDWQRMANMRLLFGYLYGHPGKKLLFMGGEFGQWREWVHEESLEWQTLENASHQGLLTWVGDLNLVYREHPALHEVDFGKDGFEWIDFLDWEQSIISFVRKARSGENTFLVVANFTPVPRHNYRVGVPRGGYWEETLNSDAARYGGSNQGNFGGLEAAPAPAHGRYHSLSLTLPPLGILFFEHKG